MLKRHHKSPIGAGRRRGVAVLAVAALAVAPLATMTAAHAAPPANDAWEDAADVRALSFRDQVDTTEATKDAVRPPGQYSENSVWYHVKLNVSGPVLMSLRGTNYFPHVLRVYHADQASDTPDQWTLVRGDRGWGQNNPAVLVNRLKADEHYFVMIGTDEETDGGSAKIVMRRPAHVTSSLARYGVFDRVDGSAVLLGTMRSTRPAEVRLEARIRQLVDGDVVSGRAVRFLDVATKSEPWRLRISSGSSFEAGPARVVSSSLRVYDEDTLVGTDHFDRGTVILR